MPSLGVLSQQDESQSRILAAKNLRSFQFIRNMYGVSEPQDRNVLLRPKRVMSGEKNIPIISNFAKNQNANLTKSTSK